MSTTTVAVADILEVERLGSAASPRAQAACATLSEDLLQEVREDVECGALDSADTLEVAGGSEIVARLAD